MRHIIAPSNGPSVSLDDKDSQRLCHSCHTQAGIVHIATYTQPFDMEGEPIKLCLHCAASAASSIIDLLDVYLQKLLKDHKNANRSR